MSATNAVVVRLMACSGSQRKISIKNPSVRFSSLTDADINFFGMGNTDLCELQQNTWAPLPKPLVVDSGAGETVTPVDWLTSHPLTVSDTSRANDFYTTADGRSFIGSLCSVLEGHCFTDEHSPGGPAESASSHLIS